MAARQVCDFLIVGAGPSGLVCAYELSKRGLSCIVVDRDEVVGGLSKSVVYQESSGNHFFDTGPKRFHSDDLIVLDFLKEISEFDTIGRSTEVYFSKRYLEWPLRSSQIPKLPMMMALKCALDLITNYSKARASSNSPSAVKKLAREIPFRDYIISQYGQTLFDAFFGPYTTKFLRWDIGDIHSDWASTGINRTVIDQRIDATSSIAVFKNLLLPAKQETLFYYPKNGGFGQFFLDLRSRIESIQNSSVSFIMNSKPISIKMNQNASLDVLLSGNRNLINASKGLIWTGNLNDLAGLIGSRSELNYLNTIFYDFIVREENVKRKGAQWTYISDGKSLISRVTSMREFNSTTTPIGYYNLVAEVTDSQKSPIYFSNFMQIRKDVKEELQRIGILSKRREPDEIYARRIVDTYPIYNLNYKSDFTAVHKQVKAFSKNIHLVGRSGAFWYNNSDHSIRMSLELVKRLMGESSEDFDYRRYFGGKPNH